MKRLLSIALILLLANSAFSQKAVELDVGLSSPNKGLVGLRYSPLSILSFGVILGSFSNFSDFGISGSYHFSEYNSQGYMDPYIFQSHHYLKSDVGNVWEITTGGGVQYIFKAGFLTFAELGIPFYIGGYNIYRNYSEGVPSNRTSNNRVIIFPFRAGIGVGYRLGWM